MSKHNNLRKLLNLPNAPDSLESKIEANWREQMQQDRYVSRTPAWAAAACLLIAIAVLSRIDYTPDVVYAALNDIDADAKHNAGLTINPDRLQAEFNIKGDIKTIPVIMSKYCKLNRNSAAHLTLTDSQLGEFHYFLSRTEFDHAAWQADSGTLQSSAWKLMHSDNGFSVLVIYDEKLNHEAVEQFTHKIFFS